MPLVDDKGFIAVGSNQLEYRYWPTLSEGENCLVVLHEGLGCVAAWKDFPSQLNAATGLPVFAWSRAGYGSSSSVSLPRPLNYMHDEASEALPIVLEHLGAARVILVGHSDGASIAAIYAGLKHDNRLAGLVLMAPHFFVEDISLAGITAARQAFEHGDLRRRLQKYHGNNTDCAFWGWNRVWLDRDFRRWNIVEYLSGIKVPIIAIQGRDDQYGTLKQLNILEEHSSCPIEKAFLENCGHSAYRDQPSATLDLISKFVAEYGDGDD